ncbi:hypothetical protein [Pseudoduganella sp. HUAS MS19]
MGWDITYHLVGADEIRSIYFKGLADQDYYKSLVTQFEVDDFYAEQLRIRFEEARRIGDDVPFNKGHAFYVAIIFGFLRKHHYIRGGAFSFLADDRVMARYVGDWALLVPENLRGRKFENRLTENYCGGVYLSNESLKTLRRDYESDPIVRSKLDEIFSHGRLAIFWQAVDDAIGNGHGLVEATEVVEPRPFNLDASSSLSNLFNCHPDGAILYSEAALEQLAAAVADNDAKKAKKKGFFSRLFRKQD